MTLFKRINTTTGDFIEECLFESHPYLTETVLKDVTDEEGTTTQQPVLQYVTSTVLVDTVDEWGIVTKVEQEQPVLDPQYVEERWQEPIYTPRYLNGVWVDVGSAPEPPAEVVLTTDQKLDRMAEQMVITQGELEAAQEALDFLLMGGM